MGKGKLRGRTESAKGNTIRPMKLRLGITIDIESELAYGCSWTGGPRWIASTISGPKCNRNKSTTSQAMILTQR